MLFVGVGALCPAFTVSGGVGCSVVRVVVSGLRCGGVYRRFQGLLFVGVCLYGFTVSGACSGVFGGLWAYPGGGLTRGETGRGSTLNILKKEKDPIKDNFLSYQC